MGKEDLRRKKEWVEEGADYVCHILHHDDKHVEAIWSTDIYSNYNTQFSPSPHYFQPGEDCERQGRGMGLWNMLTQTNEREAKRGRAPKRRAQRRRETRKKKVVWSSGGYTVAVAVVFHWTLEKNSVLPVRGACVVTWSLGHVLQKFMGARWFKDFGRLGIFFLSGFPNVQHKLNVCPTAWQMYFPHSELHRQLSFYSLNKKYQCSARPRTSSVFNFRLSFFKGKIYL